MSGMTEMTPFDKAVAEAAADFRRELEEARTEAATPTRPSWWARLVSALRKTEKEASCEEPHFGCPDCGERDGCNCRWEGVL